MGLPFLIFFYLLSTLFASFFATKTFSSLLTVKDRHFTMVLIAFLGLSVFVILFMLVYLVRLLPRFKLKTFGSQLRGRLFFFFMLTVLASFLPSLLISSRLITEITKTFFSVDLETSIQDARWFALEAYKAKMAKLEEISQSSKLVLALEIAAQEDIEGAREVATSVDPNILAIQSFRIDSEEHWLPDKYFGAEEYRLANAPDSQTGFLLLNEDVDCLRYVRLVNNRSMLIVCFYLGNNFSVRTERLDVSESITATVSASKKNLNYTALFLYLTFSLPSMFIALIIALSLSDRIASPVTELSKATSLVAKGDFSVRLPSFPNDELGDLVKAFNQMVRDLSISSALTIRTEKINVWQDIAQRLAHEIKNPLTPIRLSAERLIRKLDTKPEEVYEILESSIKTIIQEVDNLNRLLTEFRSFSRLPSPNLEPVEVFALIDESLAVFKHSYPDILFDCSAVTTGIIIRVDPRQFSQVLQNLILNAIDAMGEKGTISLGATKTQKSHGNYCKISIRDSGTGIDADNIKEIFNPYFTSKEHGTGLGLSIVERIITEHGGNIWCESAIGYGATFFIELKMEEDDE